MSANATAIHDTLTRRSWYLTPDGLSVLYAFQQHMNTQHLVAWDDCTHPACVAAREAEAHAYAVLEDGTP